MKKCELENITVYYESVGSGRPLVMLHMGYHDHRHVLGDLEPVFAQREGWQRIYPDLPGHGKTAAPAWMKTQDQVLDVILKFIDRLIPGQNFAIGGISRGGYLARGVVYNRPEQVDGLLLIAPAAGPVPRSPVPEHAALVKDLAAVAELNRRESRYVEKRVVVQTRRVLDRLRAHSFPALDLTDKRFQVKMMRHYDFSFEMDRLPSPFLKPALFLLGRQDADVGYQDAWALLNDFPRATFTVLDRAGHFLSVEQEQLFGHLVAEWLDRVEEAAG